MGKDIAIRIEGLGKEYIIGHKKTGDLRSSFGQTVKRLFGKSGGKESFWALRNIDLEIHKGEAVGIIGRNGAGKSTLLKILSRITDPTRGRYEISGRVSSLLEVGTGFHMELTGRENVFLNGTILGMTRTEIKEKFDEIVAFSGVEKFLDTPVKHYSSGMKVRLAFSVAAHLEPEVLIVDEVLAVGDAEFQKKCLGKMDEVSKSEGRTVLFVSHNMGAVENLCTSGVFLKDGCLVKHDAVQKVLMDYTRSIEADSSKFELGNRSRKGGDRFRFKKVTLLNEQFDELSYANSGAVLGIALEFDSEEVFDSLIIRIQIADQLGNICFTCNNFHSYEPFKQISSKERIICFINKLPLNEGDYFLNLQAIENLDVIDEVTNAAKVKVEKGNFFGTGKLPNKGMGLLIDHSWKIK